jgi:hypothetical protein
MDFENKKVFRVHRRRKEISMYKQCGEGDERLLPIYPQYAKYYNKVGKEEVEEAIINKNKRDNAKEFPY